MGINAGVWIDHREAHIFALTPDGDVSLTLSSNMERRGERSRDSPAHSTYEAQQVPADDRRQRAQTGDLNRYFDAVIEALRQYDRLLLMGPGEAKGELRARLLLKHHGERITAVHSAGRISRRQFAAKVKAHFGVTAETGSGTTKLSS